MPDNDSESGEEQYLRWVNEVSGASSDGGDTSSDAGDSAAATAGTSDDTGSGEVGHREDALAGTIVAERSVLPRPIVTLGQEEVTASPGKPVRVKVTVRNVGPVVETYSLSSVGNGSGWVSLVPSELSLFPGDENSAAIVIKPPRASRVGAQTYPIGIKATSEVDPNESTVAELSIRGRCARRRPWCRHVPARAWQRCGAGFQARCRQPSAEFRCALQIEGGR